MRSFNCGLAGAAGCLAIYKFVRDYCIDLSNECMKNRYSKLNSAASFLFNIENPEYSWKGKDVNFQQNFINKHFEVLRTSFSPTNEIQNCEYYKDEKTIVLHCIPMIAICTCLAALALVFHHHHHQQQRHQLRMRMKK